MNKKEEHKDNIDKMLYNIKKVEAPIFLFTKIQTKINQEARDFIPSTYVWVSAFSLMLLLMLNIWTIQQSTERQTKDGIAIIVEQMDLRSSHSFY